MIPKPPLVLLLTTLFSSAMGGGQFPTSQGHHTINEGVRVTSPTADAVLFTDRPSKGCGTIRGCSGSVCYPPQGSTDNVQITRFEVSDQNQGRSGGVAFVTSGGVGQNQVCLHFKNRARRSYRFLVNVYGFRFGISQQALGGNMVPEEETIDEDEEEQPSPVKEKKQAVRKERKKPNHKKKPNAKEDEKEEPEEEKKDMKPEEGKKDQTKEIAPPKQTNVQVSVNIPHQ